MKLYHYSHCPFCVRVRMGLRFLNIPFSTELVPYYDEKTPVALTGKKMLPIIVNDQGIAKNESLDILKEYDPQNKLSWEKLAQNQAQVDQWLNELGSDVHSLAMPHWVWSKEFNDEARAYFQAKKEAKRGPFSELVKNRASFETSMNEKLTKLETSLTPFYLSDKMTIVDIMLASHLWGLYIVPEFQFSPKLHNYLQSIKDLTHFNYQEDLWKTN